MEDPPQAYASINVSGSLSNVPEKSRADDNSSLKSFSSIGDATDFSSEMPLAAIFTDLVHDIKEAEAEAEPRHSTTSTGSTADDSQPEPELEPDSPLMPQRLSAYNSPTVHNTSPVSNFSEDGSRRKTLAGILKELIHSKLSFKFSTSDPCTTNNPPQEQETDENSNLSPTTVLHRHTESSSPTLNSILPFPASFPVVKSPMEALMLANTFSFSMSQAIPESPELRAVSPLSFDTGSPCEHLLPGRYEFYGGRNSDPLARAKSGPQNSFTDTGSRASMWSKSITFNSKGDLCLPRKTSQLVSSSYRSKSMTSLIHTKPTKMDLETDLKPSESVASRSSSKGSNTNTNTSSEFSIDLTGKSAVDMNSSRYLELDFSKEELYDVKADIRSRVEEVVRHKDESKFTFSPIASSFLFAKSASDGTNTGLFSGSLEGFIDLQPEQASSSPEKKPSLVQQMSRNGSLSHRKTNTPCFSWSCCG